MTILRRLVALARSALLLELALYRSLARWITRRPDVPSGSTPIGYAQLVGPMLWLWIFGSAVEVVAVELVLRSIDQAWAVQARLPLLVLGIWGVAWMLGLLASYRVRPHLLDADHLSVRSGARTWVRVPLSAVASVRVVEHETGGTLKTLHVDGTQVLVDVSGRTNLELVLVGGTDLESSAGGLRADRVALWVDEPRQVVGALSSAARTTTP